MTDRSIRTNDVFLSVVIPAYNEEKYIEGTILNIKKVLNDLNIKFEITVVNNNSTDNTDSIARKLEVNVIFQGERNISKTRNLGATNSKGNYLLFVDADTKITPEIISISLEKLSKNKLKAVSTITTFDKYPSIQSYGVWIYNFASRVFKLGIGQYILIHKEAFLSLKGFDESFFAFEEIEFFKRLKKRFGNESFEVLSIPVKTSGRKFEKGGKDPLKFASLLLYSFVDISIGKDKSKLDYWYSDKSEENEYSYKKYILLLVWIMFFAGNLLLLGNSELLTYSSFATPIIFILLLLLIVDNKINLKIFTVVSLLTLVIEIIGSKIGIPFGSYIYSRNYGAIGVFNVPIFIVIAWYLLISSISTIFKNRITAAIVIVIFDIFLEIFASKIGIWSWQSSTLLPILVAPILNYLSWGVITYLLYPLIKRQKLSYFYSASVLVLILSYISSSLIILGSRIGYVVYIIVLVLVIVSFLNFFRQISSPQLKSI
ncbi:MAG: carotenoid biosynthesis protein [bacterium]